MANNNSGRDKNEKDLVCSFCGKHQDEVERMIIGPGVNICSECIGLCYDLLAEKELLAAFERRRYGSALCVRKYGAFTLIAMILLPPTLLIQCS